MGLGNNTGRFAFVNIKKGKLAVKKDNETVFFNYIEGYLQGLEIRDEEYQGEQYKKLCLMINDGAEDFQLQMRLDSGYGRAFCNIILNVDLKNPMTITPTFEEVDGKQRSGMFINQNGKAVKWYFTKDHPNGLPPMKEVQFKGKTAWDNTDQQLFYMDLLLNKIKPQLSNSVVDGPPHQFGTSSERIPTAAEITEPIDDLPF